MIGFGSFGAHMTKKNAAIGLGVFAAGILAAYFFTTWRNAGDPLARYEAATAADDQGGKTPEETLNLLVAALRANDAEKAAGYFMLDDDAKRDAWIERFQIIKEKGLLVKMADEIEANAKPGTSSYEGDYGYVIYDANGNIAADMDMEFNKLSGVWKFQSF